MMGHEFDYDVIIAGGGMAGLVTAASIAIFSKQSFRILVVDRNSEAMPGKKTVNGWTCGDAVGKNSIEYIERTIGIKYAKPELEYLADGVVLYSPDRSTKIPFEGPCYALNRKLLPKRQVQDAAKLGVEFAFGVSCDRLLAEDGCVRGVTGRNLVDNSAFKKTAKVVVDSAGQATTLRPNLPVQSKVERRIDLDDLESTGRRIVEFERREKGDSSWFDSDYAIIHLNQRIAPSGYAWIFPKGETKANIGVGVQKKSLDRRNQRYGFKDDLNDLIDQYINKNKAIKNPIDSTDELDTGNTRGNWQVSVRRQNDCLVANGYAMVGDAAWMARPIDAVGISPAIHAGVILGKTISEALEANDSNEERLWSYNLSYMRERGYQMASFELLRRYLQILSDEEINYGMKYFISEDDISSLTSRENPSFHRTNMSLSPTTWIRALRRPKLARNLRYIANESKKLSDINLDFPQSPTGFEEWRNRLHHELAEAFDRFSIATAVAV